MRVNGIHACSSYLVRVCDCYFVEGLVVCRHTKKINRRAYLGISRRSTKEEKEEKVVIKYFFSDKYGDDVHKYAADNGFSPRVLGRHILSPKAFAIVMAFAEGQHFMEAAGKIADKETADDIADRELIIPIQARKICRQLLPALEKIVQKLHRKGFVHGDLRNENIILDWEAPWPRVFIVDFDYSGREGIAEYDRMNPLLCYLSQHGVTGVKVQQLHDWYFVAGLKFRSETWKL